MQAEQISLQKQNEELRDAYREKFKAQQQVQKMYQSLKAQVMASQVAVAAGDEVEMTSQTARGDRFIDRIPGTRTGTANLNKVGIGHSSNGTRQHIRAASGSSGNGGQLQGGIGLPPTFTSHMQGRVYPDRVYPSLSIPPSRRIHSIHALIN
jgi:hypothetical protein